MKRELHPSPHQLVLVCVLCTLPLVAAEQSDPPAAPGGPADSTTAPEIDKPEFNEIVVVQGKYSAGSRMFVEGAGQPGEDEEADPQGELEDKSCPLMAWGLPWLSEGYKAAQGFTDTSQWVGYEDDSGQAQLIGLVLDYCNPPSGGFNIIYSECSMAMQTDDGLLRFVIPSDGGPAEMQLAQELVVWQPSDEDSDCEGLTYGQWLNLSPDDQSGCTDPRFDLSDTPCEGEPGCNHLMPLGSVLDLESYTNSELVPRAKRTENKVNVLGSGGLVLGTQTTKVEFTLKAKNDIFQLIGFGSGASGMPGAMGMVTSTTKGHASVAPDAPGLHVIQAFYNNLSARIAQGKEVSLFGGMIKSQADLIEYGVPLKLKQKTAVRIMGLPNVMPNLGQKVRKEANVTGMAWLPSRHDWCLRNEFPADLGLFNLADLLTGEGEATPDANGGLVKQWKKGMKETFWKGKKKKGKEKKE